MLRKQKGSVKVLDRSAREGGVLDVGSGRLEPGVRKQGFQMKK